MLLRCKQIFFDIWVAVLVEMSYELIEALGYICYFNIKNIPRDLIFVGNKTKLLISNVSKN